MVKRPKTSIFFVPFLKVLKVLIVLSVSGSRFHSFGVGNTMIAVHRLCHYHGNNLGSSIFWQNQISPFTTLEGVDDPFLRLKLAISVMITAGQAAKMVLFLLRFTFLLLSLQNSALIFLEIFLIQCFTIIITLVELITLSSLLLVC